MKNNYLYQIKILLYNLRNKYNISRPKFKFPIEIHLTDHCNLNCKGCSHYSSISKSNNKSVADLRIPLSKLAILENKFSEIRLLGGEPLLNPDLIDIILLVRENLPSITIELVTNGILLLNEKLTTENFWNTLRNNNIIVSVTSYPINIDYEKIKKKCEQHKVKFKIYNTITTKDSFKSFLLDPKKTSKMSNYYKCPESECFQLVGEKIFTCAQAAYVDKLNERFNTDFKISKRDFLDLNNISTFKLLLFQNTPKPFCKYCVFPRLNTKWEQTKNIGDEWIKLS